jgi:allantoate deiminase
MKQAGLDPTELESAKRDDIAYFFELHIEQGPVLEAKGLQAGIVTDIVGITQKAYTFLGDADHGGTTPMTMRHDALRGAVRVINEVPAICQRAGDACVATVGIVNAKPGGPSSVPAEFHFTLDVRDRSAEVRRKILDEVHALVETVVAEDDLSFTQEVHNEIAPTPMDPGLVDLFDEAAEAAGVTHQRMHSGAGHDAMVFAKVVPTAMLFVPSKGGKSHTPKEFTALDDIMPGIDIMYRGFERLAYD